jgi:hypothetical protein
MVSWLVVSTPLKNISQWEGVSHILWKQMLQTTKKCRFRWIHMWYIPNGATPLSKFSKGRYGLPGTAVKVEAMEVVQPGEATVASKPPLLSMLIHQKWRLQWDIHGILMAYEWDINGI